MITHLGRMIIWYHLVHWHIITFITLVLSCCLENGIYGSTDVGLTIVGLADWRKKWWWCE